MSLAKRLALAASVVSLGVGLSACSSSPTAAPPTTGTAGPSGSTGNTGTTTSQPLTLTVTGTGPAGQVTIEDNGSETQHTGVPLPYSTTLTDNPTIVGINAQTSSNSPSATLTCSISGGSVNPVTKTSTGAYAVVQCIAGS